MRQLWTNFKTWLVAVVKAAWNAVITWFRNIGTGIVKLTFAALTGLGKLWNTFTSWLINGVKSLYGGVTGWFRGLWNRAIQLAVSGVNTIIGAVNRLFAKLRAIRIRIPVGFTLGGGIRYATVAPFGGLSDIGQVSAPQLQQGSAPQVTVNVSGDVYGDQIRQDILNAILEAERGDHNFRSSWDRATGYGGD